MISKQLIVQVFHILKQRWTESVKKKVEQAIASVLEFIFQQSHNKLLLDLFFTQS